MKRALIVIGLAACAATPAAAQFAGMPVWNSPKGGTGVTISGDYSRPDSSSGKGNAFGARATLGLSNIDVTAGFSTWKPEGASSSAKSFAGDVAFRLIGGSLIPVKVNLQAGAARTTATGSPNVTSVTGAVGFSISVPTPGVSIEPWVSPGVRYVKNDSSGVIPSGSSTNFGFAIGANVGLGMLGFHIAYDYTKLKSSQGGGHQAVIGIGAHVALKAPIGM